MAREARREEKASPGLATSSCRPFIVTTGQNNKPDADERRLIRHHARRGKGRQPRRAASQLPLGSWINSTSLPDKSPGKFTSNDPSLLVARTVASSSVSVSPLMGLGLTMEPHMMEPICNFITAMTHSMHPIQACVDMNEEGQHWFNDMNQDPSYVNLVWYVGKAYADVIQNPKFGQTSTMYMNKTIHFVQHRLSDDSLATTDTTLFGVIALAMACDGLGNVDAVKWHLTAVSRLIKLRGGMSALGQKPSLQIKCCRFDLRFSLQNGTKPYIFDEDSLSWNRYLADIKSPQPTTPLHDLCDSPDVRLVNTWLDLRRFTTAVNLAHQTRRKISSRLVQEVIISIQYRLQHLAYNNLDKFETIRVAMLAFSMTLLTEMNGIPTTYPHLIRQLRKELQALKHDGDKGWSNMILWLTFVGRLSVLVTSDDHTWLEAQLCSTKRALDLTDWAATRQVLKSILWVDVVHDEGAREFFESAGQPR